MQKNILIVTNDNVFYLLLKTFIESSSSLVECQKVMDHQMLFELTDDTTGLIIIDGKMADISPIELIYRARYEYKILCNIWFVTEIQTEIYLKKILEVGANRIIEKPFDPDEFAKSVINHVFKTESYDF